MAQHFINERIRQYTLKKKLDKGGMGEVWKASMDGPHGFTKNVCIKMMLPEASHLLDHFVTEARIGARLTHSNLVSILDFFEERGECFMVQEYLEGVNLQEAQERYAKKYGQSMPTAWVAYIGWNACKGLHFAHVAAVGPDRRGVVHRDVSLDNIFASGNGEIKVLDFGVAQVSASLRPKTAVAGIFKGKPANASPEQLRGEELDGRSDVYSLGVALYVLATGAHPFSGSASAHMLSIRILDGDIPRILSVDSTADPALAAVIESMLQTARDKRPGTAEAVSDALLEACPSLLTAARPLANFILEETAPKRSMTSPLFNGQDWARVELEAPPPAGGVVLTATPYETTARLDISTLAHVINQAPAPVAGGVPDPIHISTSVGHRSAVQAEARKPAQAGAHKPAQAEADTREPGAPSALMLPDMATERVIVRRKPSPTNIPSVQRDGRRPFSWQFLRGATTGRIATLALVIVASAGALAFRHHDRAIKAAGAAIVQRPQEAPATAAALTVSQAVNAPAPKPPPAPVEPTPSATSRAPSSTARVAVHIPTRRPVESEDDVPTAYLIVYQEPAPIHVKVDGIDAGAAPVHWKAEKGKHTVTLVRPSGATTKTVYVRPGRRYYRVNQREKSL